MAQAGVKTFGKCVHVLHQMQWCHGRALREIGQDRVCPKKDPRGEYLGWENLLGGFWAEWAGKVSVRDGNGSDIKQSGERGLMINGLWTELGAEFDLTENIVRLFSKSLHGLDPSI
ncbi:unnamed protein product [Dovyalis caffra]|uniref:Uncharacterized protein n=1 Tax=Dovyalis caffra TaxID=77055 RepID=A0AAV1S549_9ROSI|nr:unnamed protein product [Dovyalis caffra]